MEKVKKQAKLWLCIALALMLIGSIVVSAVQTGGGKISMREMNFETDAGYQMCAYLFVPDGVTAENPAPAIVTSHGFLNNKEMQDANYVELARRGFVVLAIDQPNHGESEVTAASPWGNLDAVYQSAIILSRMPFVDVERIGVTGHSMGGMSSEAALQYDAAAEEPIIAAALLNCADATYTDKEGNYINPYGSRDVGILSAVYDEFFHMLPDENGVVRESPFFMEHPYSQAFLSFGEEPTEPKAADTIYHKEIDGEDAIRVIYRPSIIHPWSHFSSRATADVIDFFDNSLGAPNPIPASNQIWQWKEAFNFVGLVGFAIFVCALATLLVFTKPFESLRADEIAQPAKVQDKGGILWFWLSLAAGALFSCLIYRAILAWGTSLKVAQQEAMGLGLWSTLCGIFTILSMVVFYYSYGKKHGMDLAALGVKMPFGKLLKSLLLGIIVAIAAYACVFAADYFFFADFRIWTLAIKAFELPILKYLPFIFLFFTFYIAHSVATNCFNYNNIGGKFNIIIIGLINALPAVILPAIQYIHYFTAKGMMWPESNMHILWLFPIIIILFASAVMSRVIYKSTKNPYIAGITNAVIIGLLTITNTCTYMF